MNPDTTSPEYMRIQADQERATRAEAIRRRELHEKALKRRKKAKKGGRR